LGCRPLPRGSQAQHCVGGVEKHRLVHGVFHLNGVIERESAPWASS
jgi:hypothetical protein